MSTHQKETVRAFLPTPAESVTLHLCSFEPLVLLSFENQALFVKRNAKMSSWLPPRSCVPSGYLFLDILAAWPRLAW